MASEYTCIHCERNVNDDDRAISCDQCEKWQHLSCDTGISLRKYRKMMKGAVVEWKCRECSRPAEVVPEVQMETADMAEEFFLFQPRGRRYSNCTQERPLRASCSTGTNVCTGRW
ncbi:hypothetical protein DPMN_004378 [Dreissena polymorpha]|uniref:PHD-type domain-containing protein n=1 Tax=Dreissena polymorpha TaxID=45954 RepID=A0A9D4MRH1_DREPO|nr:hypothetical protein DPMN_004378 [Dreissena polymorpha]